MIEINNLVKCYGSNKAVDGISFTVEKGEVLGFLGPNGAGKSTTMNIITGYLSSTSGTVKVNGHDVLEEPELAKKSIGYLPEIPPLYFDMTVMEYLKFICDVKGVKKSDRTNHLAKILSMVRIVDISDRLIANLSKGYKQRVGIAQAMIGDPEILILDEPTVGLDPNQIREIRKLIASLSHSHTIIISSHILSEIQATCDRVIILNKGKIAASESIGNLTDKLSNTKKLLLVFKAPVADVINSVRSIPGVKGASEKSSDNGLGEIEILVDGSVDVRSSIFYNMARNNWPILEFRSMDQTLEELFYNITSGI